MNNVFESERYYLCETYEGLPVIVVVHRDGTESHYDLPFLCDQPS